jgi:hypothetical protein
VGIRRSGQRARRRRSLERPGSPSGTIRGGDEVGNSDRPPSKNSVVAAHDDPRCRTRSSTTICDELDLWIALGRCLVASTRAGEQSRSPHRDRSPVRRQQVKGLPMARGRLIALRSQRSTPMQGGSSDSGQSAVTAYGPCAARRPEERSSFAG